MTARAMKDAMHRAALANDAKQALQLVKEFQQTGWWIWEGRAGTITAQAILKTARYEGHCQLCDQWFAQGDPIRWSGGACAHVVCWQKEFANASGR